jgi:hypothetical protein
VFENDPTGSQRIQGVYSITVTLDPVLAQSGFKFSIGVAEYDFAKFSKSFPRLQRLLHSSIQQRQFSIHTR